MYSPNLGYNLFFPNAEVGGEIRNQPGGPNQVWTVVDGIVTFENKDGMLVATAYRVGEEESVGSVLAA